MKRSSYAIFFPIKTPNPVYIKECLKCGARVSSAPAVQLQFCRCWVLQGSPAAAVYPAGCGVHSWRLQSSLGQQHPPCSCNRKQERQMLNTSAGLKAVSSEWTVLPYCTIGCILTQPMTMAITHTASQRCMQPKPSAHSSKKNKTWAITPACGLHSLHCLTQTGRPLWGRPLQEHFLRSAALSSSHDDEHGFTT